MIKEFKVWLYQFLRKTQKYTGTDNIYLAKGGFWLTLGQIISTAASFLLAVAFANLLDPIVYGNYRYVLSLVGILSIFTLPGMGIAIAQAAARGLEGSFYQGFKEKIKFGVLGSIAAVGLAGYYFFRGNYILPVPLLISAIFLPLMLASQVYSSFLTGKKLFNFQVKYTTLSQIISVGIIITVLFLTKNLFWLIAVYFVSHTFLNYFFYLITQKKFQPNKKKDPQTLSYGKHLSLMGVFTQIASSLDRIIIFHYLGAVGVAIYQFAIAPPEQIKGFLSSLNILALPKFSQRNITEIKKGIKNKFIKLSLFAILVVGSYILIAPFLYKIFFPQYQESILYSQLFALGMLNLPFFLFGEALEAKVKIKEQYSKNIITPIFQIGLMVVLVIWLGLLGIIIARIITRIFGGFLGFFFYHRAFSDTRQ